MHKEYDTCPEHPDTLTEWDGYCFVCPKCILNRANEEPFPIATWVSNSDL